MTPLNAQPIRSASVPTIANSAPKLITQKVNKQAAAIAVQANTSSESKLASFSFSSLQKRGLSLDECKKMEAFYLKWKGNHLSTLSKPRRIQHHSDEAPDLPRSVVLVPNGPRKGIYMILKDEIGIGGSNVVHETISLDNGAMDMVWRVGRAQDVDLNERKAIRLAASKPEDFLSGDIVKFIGTWRSRQNRKEMVENEKDPIRRIQKSKEHLKKEQEVKKIGILMDRAEGGNLLRRLLDSNFSMETHPTEMKKGCKIMLECAEKLASLHAIKLVHLDLKPENIFIVADGTLRLGDFGSTVSIGQYVDPCFGTNAILAPEVLEAQKNLKKYQVDEKADVWSLGCCFLDILGQRSPEVDWFELFEKANKDYLKKENNKFRDLETIKDRVLPQRNNNPDHKHYPLHNIIDKCLTFNPQLRPSAKQVADELRKLNR